MFEYISIPTYVNERALTPGYGNVYFNEHDYNGALEMSKEYQSFIDRLRLDGKKLSKEEISL